MRAGTREVSKLFVPVADRRQHLGTALMNLICQEADANGITLLLIAAFAGFGWLAYRKLSIVAALRPEVRWDHPGERLKSVLEQGVVAGYPVVGVNVFVTDGKEHPVDSKPIAFEVAGREAFKKATTAYVTGVIAAS